MVNRVHAALTASVTELKRDPMGTVSSSDGDAIAILNRNEPVFYCVPAKKYAEMLEKLEDIELNEIADARRNSPSVRVSWDDL